MRNPVSIAIYFGLRVGSALVLLKLSTQFLSVRDFACFAQFLAFAALLNMAVLAGSQNGLIREAAAAKHADALADVHGAALAIWLAAVPVLGIPIVLLSHSISRVLTASGRYWDVVVGLSALALAAGPGQICWALLSGRNRVAQSLGAQALGILVGTGAAAWFIFRGDFAAAALGFACGPVVAMIVAIPFTARLSLRWKPRFGKVPLQLRYSGAIASTLAFSTLTLFALRSFYRDRFGTTELGYWLAANRISDLSTQLLGLFMLQMFVPEIASAGAPAERIRILLRYGLAAAGLMGLLLIIFLFAGRQLVELFLSNRYVAAIPAIRLYMIGDFLRVGATVAMFTAFACARPARYAAIEIATFALMALLTLGLSVAGEVRAPQIAYAAAYAATALVLGMELLLRRSRRRAFPAASLAKVENA